MKNILSIGIGLFFISISTFCSAQTHLNMSLLSTWTDTTLPKNWLKASFNDCWGYTDSTGKEYAIIGSTMGTHIFNISDAANPVLVSFQQGREASGSVIHRDFKTYQHYLYAVCDEGNSSLQIFDLNYMPDSVHKIYDSEHICKTAHNIFINNEILYFCGLKDSSGTGKLLRAASLADPENPVVINDLSSALFTYVHDVNVRNDTAFLSAANAGLFIYDYTNPSSPKLIQSITNYPEQGYNHSSWVSENGKILVFADETHKMGLKVYDISDISNPTLKSIFRSNLLNDTAKNSIPHNPFIVGNDKVFVSYYHDGVQVFDISNTSAPFNAGFYDTFPEDTTYAGYGPGCWGVYPFLSSRHIIASDITHGLFILDGTQVLGVKEELIHSSDVLIFPNPNTGMLIVTSNSLANEKMQIEIYDNEGKKILYVTNYIAGSSVDLSRFSAGIYLLKIADSTSLLTKKIIKTE